MLVMGHRPFFAKLAGSKIVGSSVSLGLVVMEIEASGGCLVVRSVTKTVQRFEGEGVKCTCEGSIIR